jgi:hypothetical protein
MNQICLALPVLMGRTGHARRLLQELDGPRRVDHDQFARRLGIHKAVWYLAAIPLGDLLIAYLEVDDLDRAAALLSRSGNAFDLWVNAALHDATGTDLSTARQVPLPELLCSWTDSVRTMPSIRAAVGLTDSDK